MLRSPPELFYTNYDFPPAEYLAGGRLGAIVIELHDYIIFPALIVGFKKCKQDETHYGAIDAAVYVRKIFEHEALETSL